MSAVYANQGTIAATAIVSHEPDRSGNFVCDGTADDVEIQAAMTYVTALGGGEVFLKGGIYIVTAQIVVPASLKWFGEGVISEVRITNMALNTGVLIADTAENVEIAYIQFHAVAAAGFISSIIGGRTGTTFDVNIHHCIILADTHSGDPIPQSFVDSTAERGINTGFGTAWKIHHNLIRRIGIEGISASSDTDALTRAGPRDCEFNDNVIYQCSLGIAIEKGCQRCLIHDNVIAEAGVSSGILLNNAETKYNEVYNNVIFEGNRGVELDNGATENTIQGNFIYDVDNAGITCENGSARNKILYNTILKTGAISILLDDAQDTKCIGNVIKYSQSYGIRVITTGDKIIIENNYIEYTSNHGLELAANCNNVVIRNNHFYACLDKGIHVNHGLSDSTKKTYIEDNFFADEQAEDATTIVGNPLAGATVITVADASDFSIGEFIVTSPTGFGAENHRISDINYLDDELTLEAGLTNNHTNGDPLAGRRVMFAAITLNSGDFNVVRRTVLINSDTYAFVVQDLTADNIYETIPIQLIQGTTFISTAGEAWAWEINAAGEFAIGIGWLPPAVQQVMNIRIIGVGLAAPGAGNAMRIELTGEGATFEEGFATNSIDVANKNSEEINFAIDEVIQWLFTPTDDAQIGTLRGGDRLQIKVLHEDAGNGDIATDTIVDSIQVAIV